MKTMKLFILLIGMILISHSCSKTSFSDDELSLEKRPYIGNQLRIDGYYYNTDENGVFDTYLFYENGIILYGGAGSDFVRKEEQFISQEWINATKNSKTRWGVFQIENDNIAFERWYPSSGGPVRAFVRAGSIINDTTFHITESYRMLNGEKTEIRIEDEIYHFKHFTQKPDSTNVFVN